MESDVKFEPYETYHDLLACRVCLATETKLINIQEFDLANSYAYVLGEQVIPNDGFPQYLCHVCCALLSKYQAFKDISCRTQMVLNTALMEEAVLSTELIQNIDREALNLTYSLGTKINTDMYYMTHAEPVQKSFKIIKRSELLQQVHKTVPFTNYTKVPAVIKIEDEQDVRKDIDSEAEATDQAESEMEDYKNDHKVKGVLVGHPNINIVILPIEDQINEVLARKESITYTSSFLKCEICFKSFLKESAYQYHMSKHEPTYGEYECPVCKIRCESHLKLRSHIRITHERKFSCRLCGHIDNTSSNARLHQLWHEGHTFDCKDCGQSFAKSASYVAHARLHHPTVQYCDLCDLSFVGEQGLRLHKMRIHKVVHTSASKLKRFCEPCNMIFQSPDALNTHLITADIHTNIANGYLHHCNRCGQSFSSEELLQHHIEAHGPNTMVKCEECNLEFNNEKGLTLHKARHIKVEDSTIQRRYVCEYCGSDEKTEHQLAQHKLTHSGDKPFQCADCDRTFKHAQLLQVHRRIHTGETPFSCHVCSRLFRNKANLNRHYKVHTGEKPYQCHICMKYFTQSNSLKLHVSTVHLKLPDPYRSGRKRPKKKKEIVIEIDQPVEMDGLEFDTMEVIDAIAAHEDC